MSFFEPRRIAHEAKASQAGRLTALHLVGKPVWTPRDYAHLAREGYAKNVIAYRAIRTVAEAAASVPWSLFADQRMRDQLDRHPLLDLLRRPNPIMGTGEYIETIVGFFLIAGNAYLEAVGPRGRPPRELWSLRPDRMTVVPGRDGLPEGYEYQLGGDKQRWRVDPLTGQGPILHMRMFHPANDWYGLSPIEVAAFAIDIRNEGDTHNKALLQNDARPSGAMIYEPKDQPGASMTETQFARLKSEVDEQYTGSGNTGRPMLLDGGLRWEQMGLSQKDMDYIEGQNMSGRDIAVAFGVPPMLVGIRGDQTFANYREARLALWEETVIPLVRNLRDELNNWLVPQFDESLHLEPDLDDVPALTLRRERKFEMMEKADFLKINEKRKELGFDEDPNGDVLLVPATMVPIGQASQPPAEPAPEPDPDAPPAEDDEQRAHLFRLAYGDPPSAKPNGA